MSQEYCKLELLLLSSLERTPLFSIVYFEAECHAVPW